MPVQQYIFTNLWFVGISLLAYFWPAFTVLLLIEASLVILNIDRTPSSLVYKLIPNHISMTVFQNSCQCTVPPTSIVRAQRIILLAISSLYLLLVWVSSTLSWLPIIFIISLSAITATIGLCPLALIYALFVKIKKGKS